jgi:glycosyltransferase involved in cell wall biosynthesis
MTSGHRVALVIPALNEEATIAATVTEARRYFDGDIVVVDNGSTDATAALALAAGAQVVREPVPGYGRACMAGVAAAPHAEMLVFMDGDSSDMPEYIPALRAAAEAGADLALGIRRGPKVEPGSMTAAARFGNWLSSALLAALYGRRLHDLSPLKAVRRPFFDQLEHRELTYGWTVELLARSLRAGARIEEVEVGYRRRTGGKSKVSGDLRASTRAGVRILLTIARTALPRWTPAVRGAAAGVSVAAALLLLFALWLGSAETVTLGAWVAVWLIAWPLLLGGVLAGYGVGSVFTGD